MMKVLDPNTLKERLITQRIVFSYHKNASNNSLMKETQKCLEHQNSFSLLNINENMFNGQLLMTYITNQ